MIARADAERPMMGLTTSVPRLMSVKSHGDSRTSVKVFEACNGSQSANFTYSAFMAESSSIVLVLQQNSVTVMVRPTYYAVA